MHQESRDGGVDTERGLAHNEDSIACVLAIIDGESVGSGEEYERIVFSGGVTGSSIASSRASWGCNILSEKSGSNRQDCTVEFSCDVTSEYSS